MNFLIIKKFVNLVIIMITRALLSKSSQRSIIFKNRASFFGQQNFDPSKNYY